MIIGIGHDMTTIERIEAVLAGKQGERFLHRVLTEQERHFFEATPRDASRRWLEIVAGRFCAKEAVAKALGTGIGNMVNFQDISVVPNKLGRPICQVDRRVWEQLDLPADEMQVHLSITHEQSTVSVVVCIERISLAQLG
jgi:holo-[acyl-carrier protein] synthase